MNKAIKKKALALAFIPMLLFMNVAIPASGRVWLGVGAVAGANGAGWRTGLAIGALGGADGVLWAVAVGAVATGGAAILVGGVVTA